VTRIQIHRLFSFFVFSVTTHNASKSPKQTPTLKHNNENKNKTYLGVIEIKNVDIVEDTNSKYLQMPVILWQWRDQAPLYFYILPIREHKKGIDNILPTWWISTELPLPSCVMMDYTGNIGIIGIIQGFVLSPIVINWEE
jgi:hypothetical protein